MFKYLLVSCYVPGSVLGAGDTTVNKAAKVTKFFLSRLSTSNK